MQGMSGSPVYIDGRLVGAVALAFNFAKEPIAGIRPIEEMLAVGDQSANRNTTIARVLPKEAPRAPVPASSQDFSRQLGQHRDAGLFQRLHLRHPRTFRGGPEEARPGAAPGSFERRQSAPETGQPRAASPRRHDFGPASLGRFEHRRRGTVTEVDGQRIYAFGHQFMSVGNTELPFARAEVLTLLPNLATSFKISSAKQWMGTITQDRSTAISGELGRKAETVPSPSR